MPIMAVELVDTPTSADSHVRMAGPGDAAVISVLMSDAYEIDREHIEIVVTNVLRNTSIAKLWLLIEDDEPVSTVLTGRVEDTVSLWCMATPPRFARRGYGRALLAAVLHWAAQDGATVGLLGAAPAGEPLYRATGWTDMESWQININASSAQFS